MTTIEEKLIRQAIDGDHHAFEELIVQHESHIYSIAMKVFKNESDAFDVAQEICIKVYKKLSQFRFESSFSTWLHRLAMNTAIDEYRKQKRKITNEYSYDEPLDYGDDSLKMQIQDAGDSPEDAYLRKEKSKYVWDALNALNDEQKNIIIMKDIEGKSYQEIGEYLDIGLGTVKSRLSRARIALKKILEELWEHNLL